MECSSREGGRDVCGDGERDTWKCQEQEFSILEVWSSVVKPSHEMRSKGLPEEGADQSKTGKPRNSQWSHIMISGGREVHLEVAFRAPGWLSRLNV